MPTHSNNREHLPAASVPVRKTRPARVPIAEPTLPPFRQLEGDFRRVIGSGMLTNGDYTRSLERKMCEVTGAAACVAVSSCTSGLMLVVRAFGLDDEAEAIVPTFTWASTGHALVWNGVRPVFCDVDRDTCAMDVEMFERLIGPNTRAVLPVHPFGMPCSVDPILEIAERHGLRVLFDSAQGLGSTYKGASVGAAGDAEVFSLSPSKIVSAAEGGIIATGDLELAAELRRLRDYGKSADGQDITDFGLSARMPELGAVIALHSLETLAERAEERRARLERYRENLSQVAGVRFQTVPDDRTTTATHVVVFVDSNTLNITRDRLAAALELRGIQTRKYFHPCLHEQAAYRSIASGVSLPVSEELSKTGLALPMFTHLGLDAIDHVCEQLMRELEDAWARPALAS